MVREESKGKRKTCLDTLPSHSDFRKLTVFLYLGSEMSQAIPRQGVELR